MDVLRLVDRGRESLESIRRRLIRGEPHPVEGADVVHIDNSGSPEIAGERLLDLMAAYVGETL